MGCDNDAAIRPVRPGELEAVALLRWRWMAEAGGEPAAAREEFVAHFAAWAEACASSHRCLVAVRAETVVGMAWLAVTERVPHPGALVRASGDVQCVYVVRESAAAGWGAA